MLRAHDPFAFPSLSLPPARASVPRAKEPDFVVSDQDAYFVVRPLTPRAGAWLAQYAAHDENAAWQDGGLVVDWHAIGDVLFDLETDGLSQAL